MTPMILTKKALRLGGLGQKVSLMPIAAAALVASNLIGRNAFAQFTLPNSSVDGKQNPLKAGGNFFVTLANNAVFLITGVSFFALIVCIGLGMSGRMPWKVVGYIIAGLLALNGLAWFYELLMSAKG